MFYKEHSYSVWICKMYLQSVLSYDNSSDTKLEAKWPEFIEVKGLHKFIEWILDVKDRSYPSSTFLICIQFLPLCTRLTRCGIQTNGSESCSHVRSTSPSIMICDGLVFFLFFVSSFFSPSTETSEEPLVDLSDVLNTDADILGMLGKPSSDSGASYISQAVTVARIL